MKVDCFRGGGVMGNVLVRKLGCRGRLLGRPARSCTVERARCVLALCSCIANSCGRWCRLVVPPTPPLPWCIRLWRPCVAPFPELHCIASYALWMGDEPRLGQSCLGPLAVREGRPKCCPVFVVPLGCNSFGVERQIAAMVPPTPAPRNWSCGMWSSTRFRHRFTNRSPDGRCGVKFQQ